MQRRQVLLVDAFADGPTGGQQIAVDPTGELSRSQRRAVASELSTSGVVRVAEDELIYTDCDGDGSRAPVAAAVAGGAGLYNRGAIEPGSYQLRVPDACDLERPLPVDLDESGEVTVELPAMTPVNPDVTLEAVAATLEIDVATMRDVGADLPIATVDAFGGTLLVPVNFLQHVSSATPEIRALTELLDTAGVSRVVVFTFDTLGAQADVHARAFDPHAVGRGVELAASGVGVGACVSHLAAESVFDGDREKLAIECGRFVERPGTVRATLSVKPRIGGTALTTLDATLCVPDDVDGDEILEL